VSDRLFARRAYLHWFCFLRRISARHVSKALTGERKSL